MISLLMTLDKGQTPQKVDNDDNIDEKGDTVEAKRHESREGNKSKVNPLPLTESQMQVLISLLQVSIAQSDHHNATFALIKAISSRKYLSSEFYDLMESTLKLSVQSQNAAVRMVSYYKQCKQCGHESTAHQQFVFLPN